MRNYQYKAFGVVFSTPFPIQGLDEVSGQPEISIQFGDTPQELKNVLKKGVLFQVNNEGFLFRFDNVGRYWAKNNGKIVINKNPQASIDDVIVFLFSSVFAYILQIKGILTLHANVVHKDNFAYLIAGNSGSGKSTLTYSLLQNGYSFFCDDIAAISFDKKDQPQVAPGLPRIKLWQDALQQFSVNKKELRPIRSQVKKFYYPSEINSSLDYLRIKTMIILNSHNQDEILIKKLTGAEKFSALKSNTYRYQFLSEKKGIQPHFVLSVQLINRIDIYSVTRPNFDFKIEELQKKVEKIFNNG